MNAIRNGFRGARNPFSRKPRTFSRNGRNAALYDLCDLITVYGPDLTRRDVIRIGKKLKLKEFKNFNMPGIWNQPEYETETGQLILEEYYAGQCSWFFPAHAKKFEQLLKAFLEDGDFTSNAFNLACFFLTFSDYRLRFISEWIWQGKHTSGLRRADALEAIQFLTRFGYIEFANKSNSEYRFAATQTFAEQATLAERFAPV